jgi:hypothetical protein
MLKLKKKQREGKNSLRLIENILWFKSINSYQNMKIGIFKIETSQQKNKGKL